MFETRCKTFLLNAYLKLPGNRFWFKGSQAVELTNIN